MIKFGGVSKNLESKQMARRSLISFADRHAVEAADLDFAVLHGTQAIEYPKRLWEGQTDPRLPTGSHKTGFRDFRS